MQPLDAHGTHVIVGGFPAGRPTGHDMDYVRRRLLEDLATEGATGVSVANDYLDIERWLPLSRFLVTYAAGPYPEGAALDALDTWLDAGGRWLALHGTSGGRAARVENGRRKMVRLAHHDTLGGFFLNHPPLQRFDVAVTAEHPITEGLRAGFETVDELYLVELTRPEQTTVLLTTELATDPSPDGFGFVYDADTATIGDGRTRPIGYVRDHGAGAVVYLALGHTHDPNSNSQPFVDRSVDPDGVTPKVFRGSWETDGFATLLANGMRWGLAAA